MQCPITPDNLNDLMKLAKRYQVDRLSYLCSEFMSTDVDLSNCIKMMVPYRAPSILVICCVGMDERTRP